MARWTWSFPIRPTSRWATRKVCNAKCAIGSRTSAVRRAHGVELYERIVRDAERVLRPGGWLIMELGFLTSSRVAAMFGAGWLNPELVPDLAGIPRVIAAQWDGPPGLSA